MAWAGALQGGRAQRGFLRTAVVVVGVDAPEGLVSVVVVGVAAPDEGVSTSAFTAGSVWSVEASPISSGAVPPRRGERSSRVVAGWRFSDDTVSEGARCRPARTSLTSEGRVVEADRKASTSDMEFGGRTLSGMAIEVA